MPGNDKAFQEEGQAQVRTWRRERAWHVRRVPSAWRHLGCKGVGAGSPGLGAPVGPAASGHQRGSVCAWPKGSASTSTGNSLCRGSLADGAPAPWDETTGGRLERAGRGGAIAPGSRTHQAGAPPHTPVQVGLTAPPSWPLLQSSQDESRVTDGEAEVQPGSALGRESQRGYLPPRECSSPQCCLSASWSISSIIHTELYGFIS